MKVSVVICAHTLERYDYIIDCVNSILKQTHNNFELIIAVDNNEALAHKLKEFLSPTIKIVMNTGPKGLSNNRNVGIASSGGDVICFIDDDAYADSAWLEKLIKNYDNPDILAVGGYIKPVWEGQDPIWFPGELYWIVGCTYIGHPECKVPVRNVIGCNMSFRKSVFNRFGLFSPEIGRIGSNQISGEETEFCMRISGESNNSIIYEPDAIVYHKVPIERQNYKYILKRAYAGGLSIGIINKKFKKDKVSTLETESNYLGHTLKILVKRYLIGSIVTRNNRKVNLYKSLLIILTVAFTGFGYTRSLLLRQIL